VEMTLALLIAVVGIITDALLAPVLMFGAR
jgi:hypothetical protein